MSHVEATDDGDLHPVPWFHWEALKPRRLIHPTLFILTDCHVTALASPIWPGSVGRRASANGSGFCAADYLCN